MIRILSWKSILKQNLLMNMVCAINGAVASSVVRECKNIVWIRVGSCRVGPDRIGYCNQTSNFLLLASIED